ncbi:MAG TPA: phosphatidylglycerophosphatase A [Lentimicrobium sp.]|nr:phosphatidylglycerophosphatase A [Lentimicrobium sp.]
MKANDNLNKSPFFWRIIVTFSGIGYFPVAPGTAGSIAALIPAILIMNYAVYSSLWLLALIAVFTVLGVIGSSIMEKHWCKDPQNIVVDEAVGMWISLLFLPFNWFLVITAFILFRFFDIFKPWGISKLQDMKGGYGIMADDIVAGIAANITTQVLFILVKLFMR